MAHFHHQNIDLEFVHLPSLIVLIYGVLPWWLSWYRIRLQCGRPGFEPWVGKIPWRRERLPTPVFWPGEFHGQYSPWGHKWSDTTEQLSLHFTSLHLVVYNFTTCVGSYVDYHSQDNNSTAMRNSSLPFY